jgi:enoyl-[acyl-carrier protein] reductase / trans-2-enoyl-CoA reductase (NAD+)
MIIQPKFRGFICMTAHPTGCTAQVEKQIAYAKAQPHMTGPKKVLIIGASTGYGLASRIVSTFAAGADTIGVFFERASSGHRTATAGWYNSAALEEAATRAGYIAKSINGDAFSDEVKEKTIDLIKQVFGKVDLVVYSLAAPKRVHPKTGEVFSSVLKPIGQAYTNKNIDFHTGEVSQLTIAPATEVEMQHTIAVMGGEDWKMWIDALAAADVLTEGVITLAYSYIGPDVTHPIYRAGTVGKAKDDLEATAQQLDVQLRKRGGRAWVSVNKALVTQASSAIPIVPLYISLLYRVMKEKGWHEDCIQQIYRLFADRLYTGKLVPVDEAGRIRMDDWEMKTAVQQEIDAAWNQVNSENVFALTDIEGYRKAFFQLFGFETEGILYEEDVNPVIPIPSIPVASE